MLQQANKEQPLLTPWKEAGAITYAAMIFRSYRHWLQQPLMEGFESASDMHIAEALFEAPFPIMAHGPQPDPLLNYANRAALGLWRMEWDELIGMISRSVAEPTPHVQQERNNLLEHVKRDGFVKGYSGRRISKRGELFEIVDATAWNVIDPMGARFGQALRVNNWWYLSR